MQRLLAASLLGLLAACDDPPPPPPRVVLKEFAPAPKPPRRLAPVVAVAAAAAPAPAPAPTLGTLSRAQLVAALEEPVADQGCVVQDPWQRVGGQKYAPETLTAVVELLREQQRSGQQRSKLLVLLRNQADNPIALAYWREALPGPAVLEEQVPLTLWAGSPAQNGLSALIRYGTAEDRQRLIGWLGQSNRFDLAFMRAGNDDAEGSSAPPPPEIRAAVQRTFDDPARPAQVRAAALSTLARLTPRPTEALRAAIKDPVLRKVSVEMFPFWFEAKDLALLDAIAAADPSIVPQVDFPLTQWFADRLAGPEGRARLEALRDDKVAGHFPRLLLMLGLWASSQNEPELAKAAHRNAIAAAPDTLGMKAAHQACLAALEKTGPVPSLDDATASRARSVLSASTFKPQAAACLATLPRRAPPTGKPAGARPPNRGAP